MPCHFLNMYKPEVKKFSQPTWSFLQGPVVWSLVSANHWLRAIKTYRFPWYLTLVSTNHASSNPGLDWQSISLAQLYFSFKPDSSNCQWEAVKEIEDCISDDDLSSVVNQWHRVNFLSSAHTSSYPHHWVNCCQYLCHKICWVHA